MACETKLVVSLCLLALKSEEHEQAKMNSKRNLTRIDLNGTNQLIFNEHEKIISIEFTSYE